MKPLTLGAGHLHSQMTSSKTMHMYNTSSFSCLSLTALSFNNLSSFNFLLLSDCCFLMYFCKTKPKVPIRLNFIGSNNNIINNSFYGCGLQHLSFPRPLQLKRFVNMAAMQLIILCRTNLIRSPTTEYSLDK